MIRHFFFLKGRKAAPIRIWKCCKRFKVCVQCFLLKYVTRRSFSLQDSMTYRIKPGIVTNNYVREGFTAGKHPFKNHAEFQMAYDEHRQSLPRYPISLQCVMDLFEFRIQFRVESSLYEHVFYDGSKFDIRVEIEVDVFCRIDPGIYSRYFSFDQQTRARSAGIAHSPCNRLFLGLWVRRNHDLIVERFPMGSHHYDSLHSLS